VQQLQERAAAHSPVKGPLLAFGLRVGSTVLLVAGTLVIYQWLNRALEPRFDFWLPLDGWIPFWPATWVVYASFYLLLPLAAFWARPGTYGRTLAAVLTANVCCWVGFALFPAHYPRPSLDGVSPAWLHDALAAMWTDDLPGNTLPSIHVTTALLVALRLRDARGGPLWLAWGAAIAVSTLTVKQHFVADVVAGVVLALGINALFFPPRVEPAFEGKPVPAPPSALNVALALGLVSLLLFLQWLAANATSTPGVVAAGLGFAFLFLPAYTLLHDAEHQVFHRVRWVNEAFGVLLGCCFPGSFTFLRLCHLGHHRRNRSEVERFDVLEPGDDVTARRAYFYFLYLGGFWLVVPLATVLLVLWPSGLRTKLSRLHADSAAMVGGVTDAMLWRVRLEAALAVAVQGVGLLTFGWTWALLQAMGGLCWASQQYVTHADSPRDALDGAHNLRASRLYEALLLHFNWHLAHHQHPKVPWLYLPQFDDPRRERPAYGKAFLRFWRGPRPAETAGPALSSAPLTKP
jgi:fatty acid desaturase/membrane-associated phospholipid phosphatase